jgi:hypothetical protein
MTDHYPQNRRPNTRRWLVNDDAHLRTLFASMVCDEEMARLMNRSAVAIRTRRRLLGLLRRIRDGQRWSAEQSQAFDKMVLAGYTDHEIAKETGRTRPAIASRRCGRKRQGKLGPVPDGVKVAWSDTDDDLLRADLAAEKSISDIVKVRGWPYSAVSIRVSKILAQS